MQFGQGNKSFVDIVSDAKAHEIRLLLWPTRWQQYRPIHNLDWQIFEFNSDNIQQIPKTLVCIHFWYSQGLLTLNVSH